LKREFDLYLKDILEAIENIRSYINSLTIEEFQRSKITVDAVMRNLGIIGEAISQMPVDKKKQYSFVP